MQTRQQKKDEVVVVTERKSKGKKAVKEIKEEAEDFISPQDRKAAAVDSSSDYGSISSDESAPGLSRSFSGSESFGAKTEKAGDIDQNKIFMTEFEYNNQKWCLNFLIKQTVCPPC